MVHRFRPGALLAALALLLAVAACSDGDGAEGSSRDEDRSEQSRASADLPDGDDLPREIRRGAEIVSDSYELIDANSMGIVAYLHRNWGVPELADAAERALALADEDLGNDRLARRLVDPDAELPSPEELPSFAELGPFGPLARALSCDIEDLDADDAEMFLAVNASGGYYSTHVGLALGWISELGCEWDEGPEVQEAVVEKVASELVMRAGLGEDGVIDLSLEQAAVLLYLGEGDRVPEGWVDVARAAQMDDGGWSNMADESESDWHPTLLAIWMLLQVEGPGAGAPMVVGSGG